MTKRNVGPEAEQEKLLAELSGAKGNLDAVKTSVSAALKKGTLDFDVVKRKRDGKLALYKTSKVDDRQKIETEDTIGLGEKWADGEMLCIVLSIFRILKTQFVTCIKFLVTVAGFVN